MRSYRQQQQPYPSDSKQYPSYNRRPSNNYNVQHSSKSIRSALEEIQQKIQSKYR